MAPLLLAEGVGKDFDERPVLDGVDLALESGRTVAVLGPNGSGKTTLAHILALLLRPTRGHVSFEGRAVPRDPSVVRRRIGFVSHQPGLYLDFSPLENLAFFGRLYRVADVASRSKELLERFGLWRFREEPVRIFSRGMTQRLILARALLHDPALLLFDEPFTGLDTPGERLLLETLDLERRAGKAIFLITHDVRIAHAAATEGIVLAASRVRRRFKTDEIGVDTLEAMYRDALQEAGCATA
ncbi:MAG: ABC transporter ATP-binding protein [Planctomycetes bacterium]|nr:ABC transporter ATP-binding protein [Planctomycetota bacterium]MBI3847745.1 ABC transporter ATP-binding protein [Planctomycetota bacterium]